MKLLISMMMSVLLVGLLALTAFAQDAPQGGDAPQAAAPADAAPDGQSDGQAAEQEASPEEQRTALIESIREEMNLPAQNDIGWTADEIWMPIAASTHAQDVDQLFWFVMWVTVFFTALILILMVYFLIRYRRREGVPEPEAAPTHSTTLEITWTVIPTCIVLVIFTMGFRSFLETTVPPPNAYPVRVMGQMWNWTFTYPNGAVTTDLHIPEGRPVQFILQSQDVLHSLFIPAFRMKKDVVPGRYNKYWVVPTKAGIYQIFCAEYCGTNHSRMLAKAFVYPEDKYDVMLARISNIYVDFATGEPVPPAQVGKTLYIQRGCAGCHSTGGSVINAPTWRNLWMHEVHLENGTTVVADANYIRESILYPQRKTVRGWGNAMPSFLGQLDQRDIDSIIAYIKTLSDDAKRVETEETEEIVQPTESQSLSADPE